MANPRSALIIRVLFIMLWTGLVALAVVGIFFVILFIAGAVKSAVLDCGPRGSWGEVNYSACSDIDETNPIFFLLALATLAPIGLALLIVWARRRLPSRTPALFEQGAGRVIGTIVAAVSTLAVICVCVVLIPEVSAVRTLCAPRASEAIPDVCPTRWTEVALLTGIGVLFLIPLARALLNRFLSRRASRAPQLRQFRCR